MVVHYVTSNHLGSPFIVTDAGGMVVSRHDYLPFGEELMAGIGGRNVAMGYGVNDGLRQGFTGKERDNETGLDYFLARYYSNSHGRFTGVDPFEINFTNKETQQMFFVDPQRWDKYSYVSNNPLSLIDPDGQQQQDYKENFRQMRADQKQRGESTETPRNTVVEGLFLAPLTALLGSTVIAAIPEIIPSIGVFAARNPQLIEQAGNELLQASTGNPAPSSMPSSIPRRSPILTDTNLLVNAAEKGSMSSLAEIRGGKTFVTPNQLKEFFNVNSSSQLASRKAFLSQEGIQLFGGKQAGVVAKSFVFKNVFQSVAPNQGRSDAALAAFGKATGFTVVTTERRLFNFLTKTQPQLNVPVRRVKP
jgi:RHS repeat-associated protein